MSADACAALLLLLLARGAHACASEWDCELNGLCVEGRCECDAAWRGPRCGELAVVPGTRAHGYRPVVDNEVTGAWGGHAVRGADGRYHLFATTFTRGCDIDQWYTNSFVAHAVADAAVGPYTYESAVRGVFSHGPVASVFNDTVALVHVGCGEPQEGPEEACDGRPSDNRTATPPCAVKEGTRYRMDGYDALYTTPVSSLGHTPSWEDHGHVLWWPGDDPCLSRAETNKDEAFRQYFLDARRAEAQRTVSCNVGQDNPVARCNPAGNASAPVNRITNPSVHIFANGSALMAFRWQCDGDGDGPDAGSAPAPGRRIGLAFADDFRGPYRMRHVPLRADEVMDEELEDPFLYVDTRGAFHLLVHCLPYRGPRAGHCHLFSSDSYAWRRGAGLAASTEIKYADGTSEVVCRRERPQLLLEDGRPVALFSAVAPWVGGRGGACRYDRSYTYVQALETTRRPRTDV